ncbi:hypothetical protein PYJP_09050 [Pyrofollis japonicus]|uniref:ACT domain-containing protein n=1 Tax=Pyrofollis japonicus TaxID=3060460 RepID=UPI00295B0838|nr:ACT domain-containing protein [Pyrofollis japonicus]BEP17553.1 hypothetical protein PYJP_09050 [Pyrofollis japonicus]
MRTTEIVKVDSKGRVTIPLVVREALNIVEGMNLILIADADRREIILTPLPSTEAKLYELRIEIKDVPGALAKVASRLAELGADIVISQCTSIKRGEFAECVIVVDVSKSSKDIEEIKSELSNLDVVRFIQARSLKR